MNITDKRNREKELVSFMVAAVLSKKTWREVSVPGLCKAERVCRTTG